MTERIGIVLSGGGARGLAHAGVLAALQDEGIEPGVVAGTSSGAIVGALWASGRDPRETVEFFRTTSPFKLSRLALVGPGLLDTEKIVDDFRRYFPDDRFEALERRLFVAATDLVSGRLAIFDSGPLISAIVASSALPMLFTPTEVGGRMCSDGGILDNFPVEPVVVRSEVTIGSYAAPLERVSRGQLDSAMAVSQRAFDVAMHSVARQKFDRCDVLLSPPELRRFNLLDVRRLDEIFDIGYQHARARMGEIRRVIHDSLDLEQRPDPPPLDGQ